MNNSAMVSKSNCEGKITYVNSLFCDVSGYKKHQILSGNFNILQLNQFNSTEWDKMYESTVKYGVIWNEIISDTKKNKEKYITDTWVIAEFDEKGNHKGFLSVRHDLTDLHTSLEEIENRREVLSSVMRAIDKSSATAEFCTNGFIINANKGFLELTGWDNLHEITGKHHSIFMHPSDIKLKSYESFWKNLKKGIPQSGEFQKIRKDGSYFWVNCTYNPIIDSTGKITKILKIANDITSSVNQMIELERKNSYLEYAAKILRHDMHSGINTYIPRGISSLERRIDKIAKELGVNEDKLEDILRSPMRLLKEGLQHSQKVYTGVREFTNLVRNESILNRKQEDMSEVLRSYLKSTAYYGNVSIQPLGEDLINAPLFCTAVDNLIRNGLKYNDSNTKIVKIYRSKNSIIIEDNGRGMTNSEFEEYSKPYTRKKENKEAGSGLGLNISIAIVKEHGWKLNMLRSKKGTKLQILLDK